MVKFCAMVILQIKEGKVKGLRWTTRFPNPRSSSRKGGRLSYIKMINTQASTKILSKKRRLLLGLIYFVCVSTLALRTGT